MNAIKLFNFSFLFLILSQNVSCLSKKPEQNSNHNKLVGLIENPNAKDGNEKIRTDLKQGCNYLTASSEKSLKLFDEILFFDFNRTLKKFELTNVNYSSVLAPNKIDSTLILKLNDGRSYIKYFMYSDTKEKILIEVAMNEIKQSITNEISIGSIYSIFEDVFKKRYGFSKKDLCYECVNVATESEYQEMFFRFSKSGQLISYTYVDNSI